ncbi:hypothetical protein [Ohtaekwangia sp.]|uniref:hypothetical protein n=1 Tax=Ohtaekwangia sp. TaxID=2066019 RepID=UPI002FDE47E5
MIRIIMLTDINFTLSALKIGVTLLLLLFCLQTILAQDNINDINPLKNNQIKVNASVIGLSLNCEKSISRSLAINYEAGLSYSFYVGGGALYGNRFGYELSPIFSIENRWYYNLHKRLIKNKPTINNSGNFLSLKAGYRASPVVSKNLYNNPVFVIIPAWGIQRSIGKKVSFEFATGYAFIVDTHRKEWSRNINLSIKFGYILK